MPKVSFRKLLKKMYKTWREETGTHNWRYAIVPQPSDPVQQYVQPTHTNRWTTNWRTVQNYFSPDGRRTARISVKQHLSLWTVMLIGNLWTRLNEGCNTRCIFTTWYSKTFIRTTDTGCTFVTRRITSPKDSNILQKIKL